MSLEAIRNAAEMTAHPKLSQLLALLIVHGGLTAGEAAPLLDLPQFMVLRTLLDKMLSLLGSQPR